MNAYFIHGGVLPVFQEMIAERPRYENEFVFRLCFAQRPGQAKADFCTKEGLEFLDIKSCRIVARDVDRERGIAKNDDPLWRQIPVIMYKSGGADNKSA